jgi:AcrR family transcriptional regulator
VSSPAVRRGPGRPPGSDGAETRLKILHSAREVFSTRGFDRATLQQIAKGSGLTRNALANYYANKIELYSAALASVHDVVISRILDEQPRNDSALPARILAIYERAVETRQTDPTFVRFFVTSTSDAIHHTALREQALLPVVAVRNHIRAMLDAAQQAGEIDRAIDTEGTTQVFVDLVWGLAIDTGFYSDEHRTLRTLQALERIVVAALT